MVLEEQCNGLFVRVLSWDTGGAHVDIKKLEGKKGRVTVEVIG